MELTKYKGHTIRVEDNGDFYVMEGGTATATASTLQELKKMIDKMKKRIDLPVLVYKSGYWQDEGKYKLGKITSRIWKRDRYDADTDKHPVFRVQFPDKSWDERDPCYLIKVTDNNQETISQILAKKAQVKQLEQEIEALEKRLETYTPQELGVEQKKEGD